MGSDMQLVEFASFKCPARVPYTAVTVTQLKAQYSEGGKREMGLFVSIL